MINRFFIFFILFKAKATKCCLSVAVGRDGSGRGGCTVIGGGGSSTGSCGGACNAGSGGRGGGNKIMTVVIVMVELV